MKHIINRADIIGGLKSVKLAKKNPQYYQPGVGASAAAQAGKAVGKMKGGE